VLPTFLQAASLFCFAAASFGFLYFRFRYPKRSPMRVWGIRASHLLGFVGLAFLAFWQGGLNEVSMLVASALLVSLVGFETSERFLN